LPIMIFPAHVVIRMRNAWLAMNCAGYGKNYDIADSGNDGCS
jgi:hypothetical protein